MKTRKLAVRNAADPSKATVLIYEQIGADMWFGGGLTAKSFADDIKALGDGITEINVRINSPGGAVHDGLAIYNTLVSHPARIVVDIDGLAASAASFVAMAGEEIRIADNALMMIHLAQTMAMGDRHELERMAKTLAVHDQTIAGTYSKRSGQPAAKFLELMAEETWLSAQEALDLKMVDAITEGQAAATACAGPECLRLYRKPPPPQAKRFFRAVASVAAPTTTAPKRKKGTSMAKSGKKTHRCGACAKAKASADLWAEARKRRAARLKNEGDADPPRDDDEADGGALMGLLNDAIAAAADDERTVEDIKQELCDACGLSAEDMDMVLNGDMQCPSQDVLEDIAGVEGMPELEALTAAAEKDGCDYSNDSAEEEEEGGGETQGEGGKETAWLRRQVIALQQRVVALEGRVFADAE